MIEHWRKVWRKGIAPSLSERELQALRTGLLTDDPTLIQGATTSPPPLQCSQEWPVEAACALGYCGWQSEGLQTVQEVEKYFARKCFEVDKRMGEPAIIRWFLNWVDDTPRPEMRRQLLMEVNREMDRRPKESLESA